MLRLKPLLASNPAPAPENQTEGRKRYSAPPPRQASLATTTTTASRLTPIRFRRIATFSLGSFHTARGSQYKRWLSKREPSRSCARQLNVGFSGRAQRRGPSIVDEHSPDSDAKTREMNRHIKRERVPLSGGPATKIAAMDEEHTFPDLAVSVDEERESDFPHGGCGCCTGAELDCQIHYVTIWVAGYVVQCGGELSRRNSFRR